MTSFFNPMYWLTILPPDVGGLLGTIVGVLFMAVLILGIVVRIVVDRKEADPYFQSIGNRMANLCVTMGLLGVLLYFFSFEDIQLFGARFWYPVWIIAVLLWVFFIVRYVKRDIPQMQAKALARKEKSRYLPERKKKKKHRR